LKMVSFKRQSRSKILSVVSPDLLVNYRAGREYTEIKS
jgi:hypothetical protein